MRPTDTLVTGGRGFIGSAYLRALRDAHGDATITCIGRSAPADSKLRVTWHAADLTQPLRLPVSAARCIVHMAGVKHRHSDIYAVNVGGTERLLEWARDHGAQRFVFLSSVGVYGAPSNSGMISESTPRTPMNDYERSKNEAETLVRDFCGHHGLECVVLQPSNVIGVHEGAVHPLLGLMRAVRRGIVFRFSRDAWTNYVSVRDVADALVSATRRRDLLGTFIVNEPTPLSDFLKRLASLLDAPLRSPVLPAVVGRALGALGSELERRLGLTMPINRERVRELGNNTWYNGDFLAGACGVPIRHGIAKEISDLALSYRRAGLI